MSDRATLTSRQRQIYVYIKDYIETRNYGPTVREIARDFGIKSPNGVMGHLRALERKGYITREPYLSRAIQLMPRHKIPLPLVGIIAAGKPVAAFTQPGEIDFSWLFGGNL